MRELNYQSSKKAWQVKKKPGFSGPVITGSFEKSLMYVKNV